MRRDMSQYIRKFNSIKDWIELNLEAIPLDYRESFQNWINLTSTDNPSITQTKHALLTLKPLLNTFLRENDSELYRQWNQMRIKIEHLTEAALCITPMDDNRISLVAKTSYEQRFCFIKRTKSRQALFRDVLKRYCRDGVTELGMSAQLSDSEIEEQGIFTLRFISADKPDEHDLAFDIKLIFKEVNGVKGVSAIHVCQKGVVHEIEAKQGEDFLFSFPNSAADVTTWTHMAKCLRALDKIAIQANSFELPFSQLGAADRHSLTESSKQYYDSRTEASILSVSKSV